MAKRPEPTRAPVTVRARGVNGRLRRAFRAGRMRAVLIFSIAYWLFAVVTMPPLFAGAFVLFVVTLPFDRRRVLLHLYCCAWGTLYVVANPLWRLRVEGRQ